VVYRVSGKINNMTRKIIPLRRDAQLIIQFVFIHKAAIRNKGIIKYYISYVDFEYSPVSLPFFFTFSGDFNRKLLWNRI
jgi:hypothetical protein